jgi:hypothetical protein
VTSNEVGIAEQRAQQPGYRLGGITGKGFRPGQSGNPKGRRPGPEPPPPAISPRTLRELARGYTRECVETLATIMQTAPRTADRIEAASILLSRGWGLPTQPISAEGEVLIAVSEITKASDTLTAKLTTLAASVSRDDGPAPPRPALPAGHPTFAEKRAWLFGEVSDNGDAPSGSGAKGGGAALARIRALRASGFSLRAISRALAAKGIVARNGRPFTAQPSSHRQEPP